MKTLKIRYYKDIFMKNASIDVRDSECFQELNKSYRFAKNEARNSMMTVSRLTFNVCINMSKPRIDMPISNLMFNIFQRKLRSRDIIS
jgi:hypothetical protein